ncbi:MAG: transposase [Thermoplasmata archaeon]
MRRARLSYKGAYHHVMNRGHGGEKILLDDTAKTYFLEILERRSVSQKIRIFTYCIMDNHYHLVLQNSSGKLSEFMKQLNGEYGTYYRRRAGGSGYVFQGRFKSTLIQEDKYMDMAIVYTLLNPVRAGIASSPWRYKWSSIRECFTHRRATFIDSGFVEDLFGERKVLRALLKEWVGEELPVKRTRMGYVLGDESFIEAAIRKFDRRKKKSESRKMRKREYDFPSVEEMIKGFEKKEKIRIRKIDVKTKVGRELRNKLLVILKDGAGLPYSQIVKHSPFQSLKYSSLPQLYKRTKAQMRKI